MGKLIDIKGRRRSKESKQKAQLYRAGYVWAIAAYMLGDQSLAELTDMLDAQPEHTRNAFDTGGRKAIAELKDFKLTDYDTKRVVDFAGEL